MTNAALSMAPRRCGLFDAHCHLQLRSVLSDAVPRAQRGGVAGAAVCGCHATDWEKVEMLYQQLGQTLFGVGMVEVGWVFLGWLASWV